MASSLFNRAPKDSYQELLKLDNTGAGLDSTLRSVVDGAGNSSPFKLSSTAIALNGALWPTSLGSNGQYLKTDASGNLSWATVSVPTAVSQLTNDSGFITSSAVPTKVSQLSNDSGMLNYTGTWNATTNTPQLMSSAGTAGKLYKVSTAGASLSIGIPHGISGSFNSYQLNSTTGLSLGMGVTDSSSSTFLGIIININPGVGITVDRTVSVITGGPFSFTSYLDGITTFNVGDYVFFDGTAWRNIAGAGSAPVTSVFGRTGAIVLQSSDITTALTYTPVNPASAALTGTPTAPTATAGTNTTQIATTAFVTSAVNASGVSSFNTRTGAVTLQSSDVTTALTYTPVNPASAALTGTPTAPTAAVNTNTTQLATTAFVLGQASSTTPLQAGTAAVGTGTTFARADHVHPTDTSRASASSPVITGRTQSDSYSYTVSALGNVSGTQTLDLSAATEWTMTITGATTFAFTNTLAANRGEVVYLRVTNGGSAAITWPASTKFAAGTAPTLTSAGVDMLGVKYDVTTSTYMVFVIGLNIQ
jgi:hypothetical protein